MSAIKTTFSHHELSLLLFALQGGTGAPLPDADSCEEACPVVESVEELLCGGKLDAEQQLIRHLNTHIRESLIDCGMFEVMAAAHNGHSGPAVDQQAKLTEANARLKNWSAEVGFNTEERRLLADSLARMPRSAWLMMPRIMWRLRKKLRSDLG